MSKAEYDDSWWWRLDVPKHWGAGLLCKYAYNTAFLTPRALNTAFLTPRALNS